MQIDDWSCPSKQSRLHVEIGKIYLLLQAEKCSQKSWNKDKNANDVRIKVSWKFYDFKPIQHKINKSKIIATYRKNVFHRILCELVPFVAALHFLLCLNESQQNSQKNIAVDEDNPRACAFHLFNPVQKWAVMLSDWKQKCNQFRNSRCLSGYLAKMLWAVKILLKKC